MAPKKSTIVLNVEQFIHDVEERPAIWNRNFHCNKAFLEQMWDELSEAHSLPKVILKAKWKGLRDNFRVEYKRIPRADNGDFLIEPAAFESKWIHYNALLFLTDHMRHRLPKNEQDQSFFFTQQSQDCEKTVVEPDLSNGLSRQLQDSDDDFDDEFNDEEEDNGTLRNDTLTPPAAHASSIPASNNLLKTEETRSLLNNASSIFLNAAALAAAASLDKEVQDLSKKSHAASSPDNSSYSNSSTNISISNNNNNNSFQNNNINLANSLSYSSSNNFNASALNSIISNNITNSVKSASLTNYKNFSPGGGGGAGNGESRPTSVSPATVESPPQNAALAAAQLLANAFPVLVNVSSLANSRHNHFTATNLSSNLTPSHAPKKRSVSPPPLYNKAHNPLPLNQNSITTTTALSKDRDDFHSGPPIANIASLTHENLAYNKHPYLNDLIPALRLKKPRLSEDSNFNGSSTMDTSSPLVPEDDDYHYLLSLHPYMKQLTAVEKLRIRTNIQKLIFKELYKEDLDESK